MGHEREGEDGQVACPYVDRQRAVNEIALVNTETGEVEYGIKSLFKVIGNSAPVFKPLFSFNPFVSAATSHHHRRFSAVIPESDNFAQPF